MKDIKNYIERRIKNCQRHIDDFNEKYDISDENIVTNVLNYHGGYRYGYWDGRCEAFKEILDELESVSRHEKYKELLLCEKIDFENVGDGYFQSVDTTFPYTIYYDKENLKYVGYMGEPNAVVRLIISSDENINIVKTKLYNHYIQQIQFVRKLRNIANEQNQL